MTYSINEVKKYVEQYSNCKLLSNIYKTAEDPLIFKCACGNIFKQSFRTFKCSPIKCCKSCRYKKLAKTTEEFKKEVYDLEGNNYEVVGQYKNARTKIKMKHNKCGYEYFVLPRAFLEQNNRCPNCNPKKKKTHEEFCNDVYRLVGNEYTILDKYIDSLTKIHIRHNKCGYIWYTSPNNFLNGTRCPTCYRSRGEEVIAKFLDDRNIQYKEEYKFVDCNYIAPLRFDFYLPEHNACIEYDGRQHFQPMTFGEKDRNKVIKKFKNLKKRDKIKSQYCQNNNILLLRIPYWNFNDINYILSKWIENNFTYKTKILSK